MPAKPGGTDPREVTRNITAAATALDLLGVLEKEMRGGALNQIHISAAFARLAKVRRTIDENVRKSQVLTALMSELLRNIEARALGARGGANIFWAVVKLKDVLPEASRVVPPLVTALEECASGLEAQEVSNVLWACATYGPEKLAAGRLLHLLSERVAACAQGMKVQEVSNVAWAVAKLAAKHPKVLQAMPVVGELAAARAADMNAQDLANFLWAAATVAERAPLPEQHLAALAGAVPARVPEMVAQEVANVMWAVAVLQERAPTMNSIMPQLAQAAARQARGFKKTELPMVIWSVTQAGLDADCTTPLFTALHPIMMAEGPTTFTPQGFAMCCCGIALGGWRSAKLMKHLAALILLRLPAWTDKDLLLNAPQVAWAYARLRLQPDGLFQAIARGSTGSLARMSDWSVCALAWSYRRVDKWGEFAPFLALLEAELARRRLSEERVANSGYGLKAWHRVGFSRPPEV